MTGSQKQNALAKAKREAYREEYKQRMERLRASAKGSDFSNNYTYLGSFAVQRQGKLDMKTFQGTHAELGHAVEQLYANGGRRVFHRFEPYETSVFPNFEPAISIHM